METAHSQKFLSKRMRNIEKGYHFMSQTLYFNGTILTMDEPLFAESVLTEDGKILSVGNLKDLQDAADEDVTYFDLQGQTMLPAFLDAHSHFSGYANSLLQVPLEECSSAEEIIDKIRQFLSSASLSEEQWVICKGYDHNQLPNHTHIDRFILDQASNSHPIVVQHKSGHLGIFNSCALSRLGITSDTPVPDGGVIGQKDGVLTGYMEENAFIQVLSSVPMPSAKELMEAFVKAQQRYASYGITTIQEGMMPDSLIPLYQALLSNHLLNLDVVGYVDAKNSEKICSCFPTHLRQYENHFKIGGYKIFLDGSPQGRTAWMRTPYLDSDGYCGYPTISEEEIFSVLEKAQKNKMQLLAHCNGDAACAQYLSCIDTFQEKGGHLKELRPVMIHSQLLDYDQLDLVKKLGVIPSFFVAHVYHWGDTHIKNFGLSRASRISPAASSFKKEILFTFHQDTPVIEPDILETIWCAANRMTKAGILLGADEQLPVLEALKAVTIHAAYQYFEENQKGSITPGKFADFVILSDNPLKIEKENLRSIKVCHTIKQDRIIYSKSEK